MVPSIVICCALLAALPPEPDWKSYQEAKAQARRDPQAHIQLALWCGEHGLDAERQKHLAIALVIEPDNATARGLMGFVSQGGRWKRVEAIEEQAHSIVEPTTARAEYQTKRAKMRNTADAHWQMVLWCEQRGLKPEALAHSAKVVGLDPSREAPWKRLGYKKHNGRWLTDAQIAAEKVEIEAQAKADREWLPLMSTWRERLADKDKRAGVGSLLAAVTDPKAVPSVWRVFGTGRTSEQAVSVQVLGQIDSARAARALAVLAVFGKSAEVRRTATETLARRDPRQYAQLLVGLLRDPVKYEVKPIGGPGRPGSLVVKGGPFPIERIYAPPPPPNIPIFPGENLTFDPSGLPIIIRNTDETVLPFAWVYFGTTFPSRSVIPPHVPATIQIGKMWLENWKSARSAQEQLRGDVTAIERRNDLLLAANGQVVQVLNQATGQTLPVDRTAWRAWWSGQIGRTYTPETEPPRPILKQAVPLTYLPQNVGGLGFDPIAGYYLWIPVDW